MIIKHKDQRVGVFIDAQNLYHSGKSLYDRNVDFGAILRETVGDRKLIRAIAYVIATEQSSEDTFFEALTKLGIETRVKDLQIFSSGNKKGDWDVGLAVDAITLAERLDAIIIVSGDGDFVPLVEYLRMRAGVQVEVASFTQSTSARLIEAADDFLDLSLNKDTFLLRKPYSKNATRKRTPARHRT